MLAEGASQSVCVDVTAGTLGRDVMLTVTQTAGTATGGFIASSPGHTPHERVAWYPLFMHARDNCKNIWNRVSKRIRKPS